MADKANGTPGAAAPAQVVGMPTYSGRSASDRLV